MCGQEEIPNLVAERTPSVALTLIAPLMLKTACSFGHRRLKTWLQAFLKIKSEALTPCESRLITFISTYHCFTRSHWAARATVCRSIWWNGGEMVIAINKLLIIFNGGEINETAVGKSMQWKMGYILNMVNLSHQRDLESSVWKTWYVISVTIVTPHTQTDT